ncbi:hypothetical protein [Leyella lascolaii]|uniref:hypothetical protein n=1 Tax=Leyella lascolaii TaxID=1776379 RepID=UPI00294352C6|nr:hypothetical protein [Leyella lascolaii]
MYSEFTLSGIISFVSLSSPAANGMVSTPSRKARAYVTVTPFMRRHKAVCRIWER